MDGSLIVARVEDGRFQALNWTRAVGHKGAYSRCLDAQWSCGSCNLGQCSMASVKDLPRLFKNPKNLLLNVVRPTNIPLVVLSSFR